MQSSLESIFTAFHYVFNGIIADLFDATAMQDIMYLNVKMPPADEDYLSRSQTQRCNLIN